VPLSPTQTLGPGCPKSHKVIALSGQLISLSGRGGGAGKGPAGAARCKGGLSAPGIQEALLALGGSCGVYFSAIVLITERKGKKGGFFDAV